MVKMNVIMVYDLEEQNILMCLRAKDPYKGLYNLVGGKIEAGEAGLESAYRELKEETGITQVDIALTHVMDFQYRITDMELQVYTGKLNKKVEIIEELNQLVWINASDNFFDMSRCAGEGNIGHMVECVKRYYREQILLDK